MLCINRLLKNQEKNKPSSLGAIRSREHKKERKKKDFVNHKVKLEKFYPEVLIVIKYKNSKKIPALHNGSLNKFWVTCCLLSVCDSCIVVRALLQFLQPPTHTHMHAHQPPPPMEQAARVLDHSKVNREDVFLDTGTFKNRKARRFINRALENVQYFCLTKTSVAQKSIWNSECFRLPLRRCVGWWLSVDLAPGEVSLTP